MFSALFYECWSQALMVKGGSNEMLEEVVLCFLPVVQLIGKKSKVLGVIMNLFLSRCCWTVSFVSWGMTTYQRLLCWGIWWILVRIDNRKVGPELVYLSSHCASDKMWHKVIFYNWIEFKIFFFLYWLQHQV